MSALLIDHTWVGDLVVTLTNGTTTRIIVDRPGVRKPESRAGSSHPAPTENYSNLAASAEHCKQVLARGTLGFRTEDDYTAKTLDQDEQETAPSR